MSPSLCQGLCPASSAPALPYLGKDIHPLQHPLHLQILLFSEVGEQRLKLPSLKAEQVVAPCLRPALPVGQKQPWGKPIPGAAATPAPSTHPANLVAAHSGSQCSQALPAQTAASTTATSPCTRTLLPVWLLQGTTDEHTPACWAQAAAWRAWCGCQSGCSSPAGPRCWEQRTGSVLVSCRGREVFTCSQPSQQVRCHPDLSCHLHPDLLYAWSLSPVLPFGNLSLLLHHSPRNRDKGPQCPQLTGSLPAYAQVLACEPALGLCLGRDAKVGQGLLPPEGTSVPRGCSVLTAPGSGMVQVSPAAHPSPSGITRLTRSFSASSRISSAARPAWPCSAAI